MRIIIAGDGETGTHLARMLSVENQDIVLMGADRRHLAELDAESNFITFVGNPMSRSDLSECGVERAGLFVAVTPEETENLLACEIARDCGARRTVARIDNPELDTPAMTSLFARHGIDKTILPERLAATEIARFIDHNWISEWMQFGGGELLVTGVRMEAGGSIAGKCLRDIPNVPRRFHVAAIRRGNRIIIPRGDDRLDIDDIVYFSVRPNDIEMLRGLCGKRASSIKRIMISGAGRVTENLLAIIGGGYDITVIDPDRDRCEVIARKFPHVVTVNAPVNDIATLTEEGIAACDMFLALTGSSETNIVSCMVAREHKVSKTLARIEELQYIPEAKSLSIDKIINKKLLNAGEILNMVLDSGDMSAQSLSLDGAEMIALTAVSGSRIVSKRLCELSLPRELTVVGLIRDGNGMLADGGTVIVAGDRVVVFFVEGALTKVQKLFR